FVPATAEGGAEQLLRAADRTAVRVGRVEEAHPQVKGHVHHFVGTLGVDPAAEVVAADTDDGYHQTGVAEATESHVSHVGDPISCVSALWCRRGPRWAARTIQYPRSVSDSRAIDDILQRAADGGRISPDEALLLYTDAPLHPLGEAADAVRRRRYPDGIV